MRKANFAIRLLPSISNELKRVSEQEGVSVNQYINVAVTEKLATQRAADFFAERIKRSSPGNMRAILAMAGSDEPEPENDEVFYPD